jgi:hypothetical protein
MRTVICACKTINRRRVHHTISESHKKYEERHKNENNIEASERAGE